MQTKNKTTSYDLSKYTKEEINKWYEHEIADITEYEKEQKLKDKNWNYEKELEKWNQDRKTGKIKVKEDDIDYTLDEEHKMLIRKYYVGHIDETEEEKEKNILKIIEQEQWHTGYEKKYGKNKKIKMTIPKAIEELDKKGWYQHKLKTAKWLLNKFPILKENFTEKTMAMSMALKQQKIHSMQKARPKQTLNEAEKEKRNNWKHK